MINNSAINKELNKPILTGFSSWGMVFIFSLLLTACTGDNQDLLDTFERVKAKKGRPIESVPEVKFVEKFIYPSHLKRRDPFHQYKKPSKVTAQKNKLDVNAPNMTRKKEILETFKLRDLRMVGTLEQKGITWGLIATAKDEIYKVTVGQYLGEDYGQVVNISNKNIKLVEKYKKKNIWHKRSAVLALDVTDKKTISHKKIKFEEIVR